MRFIQSKIEKSIKLKKRVLKDDNLLKNIEFASKLCIETFKNGGKVLFCGNGGSASDAQHLSAELSGRFYKDREPLFAEALHVNTSFLTAVANDYSFEEVYARMLQAMGKKGDVLIALSTSGNSKNIVNTVKKANELGVKTISLTGKTGGLLKDISNVLINVDSKDTPRIQETHILIGHIICEIIENEMF